MLLPLKFLVDACDGNYEDATKDFDGNGDGFGKLQVSCEGVALFISLFPSFLNWFLCFFSFAGRKEIKWK